MNRIKTVYPAPYYELVLDGIVHKMSFSELQALHDQTQSLLSQNETDQLIALAADHFNVTMNEILSCSPRPKLAHIRWVLMKVLHDGHMIVCDIARVMHRDRTSVVYGLQELPGLLEVDRQFATQVGEFYIRVYQFAGRVPKGKPPCGCGINPPPLPALNP